MNSDGLVLSLAMVGCGVTDKVGDCLRLRGSLDPWGIELVSQMLQESQHMARFSNITLSEQILQIYLVSIMLSGPGLISMSHAALTTTREM